MAAPRSYLCRECRCRHAERRSARECCASVVAERKAAMAYRQFKEKLEAAGQQRLF